MQTTVVICSYRTQSQSQTLLGLWCERGGGEFSRNVSVTFGDCDACAAVIW